MTERNRKGNEIMGVAMYSVLALCVQPRIHSRLHNISRGYTFTYTLTCCQFKYHKVHVLCCWPMYSDNCPYSSSCVILLFLVWRQCPAPSCIRWPCQHNLLPGPQDGVIAPQHWQWWTDHGTFGCYWRICWCIAAHHWQFQVEPHCSVQGVCWA